MYYHSKIIDFFKRHNMYDEEVFKYLRQNTTFIDYGIEEDRCFIGCFYILDKKDVLKGVKLTIPYATDDKTILISIHELTHGIENYYKIGRKFKKSITIETLPLLYEKLYILENPTKELIAYGEYLDKMIEENDQDEYKFAIKVRDELLKDYARNMYKAQKQATKMARRYR